MPKANDPLEAYRQSLEAQLNGYRDELQAHLNSKLAEYKEELRVMISDRLNVPEDWPFQLDLKLDLNLVLDVIKK